MTNLEYDINQLFSNVFGYVGLPYFALPKDKKLSIEERDKIEIIQAETYGEQKDKLGRPVFSPVKINGKWLPNEPLVTIQASKTIVKTVVAGRIGTVKELISTNDYKIKIQGFIINYENLDYPEKEVEELHELFKTDKALEIHSRLFDSLEINSAVVESFNLPAMQGKTNIQAYELNLISDDEFDVYFSE